MACPYFRPLTPCSGSIDSHHAMLPLGDLWTGVCCADGGHPCRPDDAALKPLCNLGYARGACDRFPPDDGPDAVRFAVRGDDGARLRVYYVLERDHHPFAHGPLNFSLPGGALLSQVPGEALARQAHAYVESYLRRKSEAYAR